MGFERTEIRTYNCPSCGKEIPFTRAICSCGADLSLLQGLDALSDAWFNRALKALSEGNRGRALEWLAACCAARPMDADARRAMAKVWAQLGHVNEAKAALELARDIDPENPEVAEIDLALLESSQHPDSRKKIPVTTARATVVSPGNGSRKKRNKRRKSKKRKRRN